MPSFMIPSMLSRDATPSYRAKIASLIIGFSDLVKRLEHFGFHLQIFRYGFDDKESVTQFGKLRHGSDSLDDRLLFCCRQALFIHITLQPLVDRFHSTREKVFTDLAHDN